MLVLSRKPGESVELQTLTGQTIATVQLVEIGQNRVRLAFDADASVKIWRSELLPIVEAPPL